MSDRKHQPLLACRMVAGNERIYVVWDTLGRIAEVLDGSPNTTISLTRAYPSMLISTFELEITRREMNGLRSLASWDELPGLEGM